MHLLGFCLDGQQSVHARPSLTQLHLTHRPLLMHEEQASIFWLVLVVCVKWDSTEVESSERKHRGPLQPPFFRPSCRYLHMGCLCVLKDSSAWNWQHSYTHTHTHTHSHTHTHTLTHTHTHTCPFNWTSSTPSIHSEYAWSANNAPAHAQVESYLVWRSVIVISATSHSLACVDIVATVGARWKLQCDKPPAPWGALLA